MWPLQAIQSGVGLFATRYARFCLVGTTGVLVDMLVLFLLASSSTVGLDTTLSKVIAAGAATFNNFFWNEFRTFREISQLQDEITARLERLAKFTLIPLSGIAFSVLLLNFQVGCLGLNLYFANAIAIAIVSLWNFRLNLRFVWRS